MQAFYKIAIHIVVLTILIFASCQWNDSKKASEATATTSANEQATEANNRSTAIEATPSIDTLRINTADLGTLFDDEYAISIFKKLKSSTKYETRMVDNLHVEEKDVVYTFKTADAEYLFLEVTNSKTVFILHINAKWSEEKLAKITGIKKQITNIVADANVDRQSALVVCFSDAEGMSNLFVTYDDAGEIVNYYINSWFD